MRDVSACTMYKIS
uniref:Uncharacterized protein n=1 Tax=Anguilla anguilla TaxID=7936 RepID=A0A0E9UHZ2_ANGAN